MPAPSFLKTMGYPELFGPDRHPLRFKVRKHLALLVYLAVDHRSVHRREALVEMFWGGVSLEKGRHSLSVALSVLRAVLSPDAIHGSPTQVRFNRSAVTIDLDLMSRGELLEDETAPPLEVDGFLRDFDLSDTPAFQHWRDGQQAQLLPAIQAGLLIFADHARRSGDMVRLMTVAERLLVLDQLAEEGIRAKMESFAMQGDRVSALRIFESWKEQLGQQLGAAPSDHMAGMAARLRRRGVDSPVAAVGPVVQTEHWAARRFVGRAAEFRAVFDAWESSTQLNTRHILLTGETGIGKSTLAMRFGTAAALEGAAVARVQCFELEQRIAFGMIGALVAGLLDRPGAIATAPTALAEIARVLPMVRERFPNLPAPRRLEGEAARLHFAEGTFALFESIMDEQPLVLIVDDYPRSDEASLSVLHMLLRRAGTERLMVVLAGRPPEPDEPPQAARIRKGVAYLPMRRLDLAPLTESEGAELLRAVLEGTGKEPDPPARRAILRAASGNPLALELLTQDWTTHGDAAIAVSLPAMRSEVPASALEAVGYDRLIERLLPALTPRTRVTLHLATILGPRLNDMESFELVELTVTQAMAAMGDLVARRVLRDVGERLEFTNELIRARIYLKIPSAIRTRMHNGVADRLLAAVEAGEQVPGLEIAWHCIRARRREEATPYLMRGAREAIAHGAPDEAARALSSALSHLRGRAKEEATLLLAETYQEMAEWKGSLEMLEMLGTRNGPPTRDAELYEVLNIKAHLELNPHDAEARAAGIRRLIALATGGSDARAQVRAGLITASSTELTRSTDACVRIEHALATMDVSTLEPREQGMHILAGAMIHYSRRDNAKTRSAIARTLEVLAEGGVTDSTYVRTKTGVGVLACATGAYEDGIASLEEAYNSALRLDNEPTMSSIACNLSLCHYRLGHYDAYRQWAMTALHRSRSQPRGSYLRIRSLSQVAISNAILGIAEVARANLALLRAERAHAQLPWITQTARLDEADALYYLGEKRRALGAASSVCGPTEVPLSIGLVGQFARWCALIGLTQAGATGQLNRLLPYQDETLTLDAIDRVELSISIVRLKMELGEVDDALHNRARIALAALPEACAWQLGRLGLLGSDRGPKAVPKTAL